MSRPYQNEDDIEAVVKGFETCTIAKDDFTHRSHLTVAVWYLLKLDRDQALSSMRTGLLRFLDHHGIDRAKYKEGLTAAWIDLINQNIAQFDPGASLVEITNRIVDGLANTRLPE